MGHPHHTPSPPNRGITTEGAEGRWSETKIGRPAVKCFLKTRAPLHTQELTSAKAECTDLYKIKPVQISTCAGEGLKKLNPTVRSYWQLMVTEGGSIFFTAAALGRLPMVRWMALCPCNNRTQRFETMKYIKLWEGYSWGRSWKSWRVGTGGEIWSKHTIPLA